MLSYGNNEKLEEYYAGKELLQYFTPEAQDKLRQEVIHTINHELLHPEDVETMVPKLYKSCTTEAIEVRRSINSIVSLQVAEAQRALELVQSSSDRVKELKEQMLKQAELVKGVQEDSLPSRHLRQLNVLRENIRAVIRWSTALKEVRYENLFSLVQLREFSALYTKVKELQSIRETVVKKAGEQYNKLENALEPYFSKLDLICHALVTELYTLWREEGASIAIQKALMDSDSQDPVGFSALKECCAVCLEELEHPVLRIPSASSSPEESHSLASYSPGITRQQLEECMTENIEKLWKQQILVEGLNPIENTAEYLKRLKKVEPLLEALQMTLTPLSSSKFLFFDVVLMALHARVIDSVHFFAERKSTLEANILLEASQFVQWYKCMLISYEMSSKINLKEVDSLSAMFMTTAVSGLSAHLSRLCQATALGVLKQTPSFLPGEKMPVTSGPVDLFAILQQTLTGLSAGLTQHVLESIGNACVDAILMYLETCKDGMDYDLWEERHPSAGAPDESEIRSEWEQKRMALLYALSNDYNTIEKNIESIESKFAVCWDPNPLIGSEMAPSSSVHKPSPFMKVQDFLSDTNLFFMDELIEQVERVVGSQWTLAFRQGVWYNVTENPVLIILNTEEEYVKEEFFLMLPEPKARKLSKQLFLRFMKMYLSFLLEYLADVIRNSRKTPLDNVGDFINNIVRDIGLIEEVWRRLLSAREIQGGLLSTSLEALRVMKELLCVKKPVDLEYVLKDQLMENFGDCPTFVIQYALESRPKELTTENKARMLELWMDTIRPQQRDQKDVPTAGWGRAPSIFGQLDRVIGEYYKAGGLFYKSAKKVLLAERQQKRLEDKEKKRQNRLGK